MTRHHTTSVWALFRQRSLVLISELRKTTSDDVWYWWSGVCSKCLSERYEQLSDRYKWLSWQQREIIREEGLLESIADEHPPQAWNAWLHTAAPGFKYTLLAFVAQKCNHLEKNFNRTKETRNYKRNGLKEVIGTIMLTGFKQTWKLYKNKCLKSIPCVKNFSEAELLRSARNSCTDRVTVFTQSREMLSLARNGPKQQMKIYQLKRLSVWRTLRSLRRFKFFGFFFNERCR